MYHSYYLYIRTDNLSVNTEILGVEAAYNAYQHASALADLFKVTCDLVDGCTGEILASTDPDF